MTEAQWLAARRPIGMLLFLRDGISERKVLLFNCACCRLIWPHLGDEDRKAAALAEISADDPTAILELRRRLDPERAAALTIAGLSDKAVNEDLAALLATQTHIRLGLLGKGPGVGILAYEAALLFAKVIPECARQESQFLHEEERQTGLVRDIFGNPFRPVTLSPSWVTSAVTALARQMYEARDFSAMPILANALQDAGCACDAILNHCRGLGPHVCGCWVVDRILGKE
jgi:hypothetical protein